jgi:hypothetical protein
VSRALAVLALASACAFAGPPFQTDDPEPIDYKRSELYTFASSDGAAVATDTAGPAVEYNYGPLPNVHLHIIVPLAAIFHTAIGQTENYVYLGLYWTWGKENKPDPAAPPGKSSAIPFRNMSAPGLMGHAE